MNLTPTWFTSNTRGSHMKGLRSAQRKKGMSVTQNEIPEDCQFQDPISFLQCLQLRPVQAVGLQKDDIAELTLDKSGIPRRKSKRSTKTVLEEVSTNTDSGVVRSKGRDNSVIKSKEDQDQSTKNNTDSEKRDDSRRNSEQINPIVAGTGHFVDDENNFHGDKDSFHFYRKWTKENVSSTGSTTNRKCFIFNDQTYSNKDKYIFRDRNTKPVLYFSNSTNAVRSFSNDFIPNEKRKSHKQKRRYNKLMTSLKDGEKKLLDNLKEAQLLESNCLCDEEISQFNQKLKENLRVREKKKYQSLINYQRDKCQAHQKTFQEMLPDKVELVKTSFEKPFELSKPGQSTLKKKRGRRPKNPDSKEPHMQSSSDNSEKKLVISPVIKPQKRTYNKKSLVKKRERKKSVKLSNFRIEIVNKDGAEQVIELKGDEMRHKLLSKKITDSSNTETIQNTEKCLDGQAKKKRCDKGKRSGVKKRNLPTLRQECSVKQDACTVDKRHTLPATFTLPTVSSLEADYELVSLSQNDSVKNGDFKKHQFFIPQYTFNKEGKTSMIMVGPFRIVSEPQPHLVLVSPGETQEGTTMIVQRKVHSPSSTPPRDFRIRKDGRQGGAPCRPATHQVTGRLHLTQLDHNYMTPPRLWERVKRYCRAVAKHSAYAKFIDARVEDIEPADDNVLVTIRGNNVLRLINELPDPAQAPVRTSKDGMPLIYTLSQIMTPALKNAEARKRREQMIEESMKTGDYTPVVFPLSSMGGAIMEVVIPPAGTELMPVKKGQMKKASVQEAELDEQLLLNPSAKSGSNTCVRFLHGKTICVEHEAAKAAKETSSNPIGMQNKGDLPSSGSCNSNDAAVIEVENEASVVAHAARTPGSGLPCCRLCLRLFSSASTLLSHVRSTHQQDSLQSQQGLFETSSNSSDGHLPSYLEELSVGEKSCLVCPACPPSHSPVLLASPGQLRRHMQQFHNASYPWGQRGGSCRNKVHSHVNQQRHLHNPAHFATSCPPYRYSQHGCNICPARFPDTTQLEMHLQMAHASSLHHQPYHQPSMINLIKPQQNASCSGDNQRSLLSDCLLCSKCNTVYRDRSALLCHTLKVHPELNQFNVCKLCDRLFDNNLGLHRHLKKAHGLNHSGTLKCPFCPAWLPSVEMASIHRATLHTGALPVHCPFCGAGFQGMHGIYNHVRIHHLQTEAHICPECQASFSSTRALSEHARKVHGMTAQALRESLHSSNSTTYCCPFCMVALSRTYELAAHVINAHRDHLLPSQCHLCLQAFVSDPILKIHLAGAHGLEVGNVQEDAEVADEEEVEEEEMEEERHSFFQQRQQQQHMDHFQDFQHGQRDMGVKEGSGSGDTDRKFSYQRHSFDEEQDILETQEAGRFLEELQQQETNTINYLSERNSLRTIPIEQHATSEQIFAECGSLEDEVTLLGSHDDEFNLSHVDYLETLTNDSIAVGADVIAAADAAANNAQIVSSQDPLELPYQFEIDGVLYQLASSMDSSGQQVTAMDTSSAISEGLAHLLQQ